MKSIWLEAVFAAVIITAGLIALIIAVVCAMKYIGVI